MYDTPSILSAYVDSHSHLALTAEVVPDFSERLADFLGGGGLVLDVGTQEGDALGRSAWWSEGVRYSLGIHPSESVRSREPDWDRLERDLGQGASAVGETGLDFFRSPETEKKQRHWFRCHLEISRRTGLPVIIHCRKAARAVLEDVAAEPPSGGVLHCFSEDWETAQAALDLGLMMSFAGNLTYPSAHALREVAAKVPDDRWLIESDAPYLAPNPKRGHKNHPDFLVYTLEVLASLRELDVELAMEQSRKNYFAFLRA